MKENTMPVLSGQREENTMPEGQMKETFPLGQSLRDTLEKCLALGHALADTPKTVSIYTAPGQTNLISTKTLILSALRKQGLTPITGHTAQIAREAIPSLRDCNTLLEMGDILYPLNRILKSLAHAPNVIIQDMFDMIEDFNELPVDHDIAKKVFLHALERLEKALLVDNSVRYKCLIVSPLFNTGATNMTFSTYVETSRNPSLLIAKLHYSA